MKKVIFVFTPIFLAALIVFCCITPSVTMSENISSKVFRLHIIANSDSVSDQRLKLNVRDDILKVSESMYSQCKDVNDAVKITRKNIQLLQNTACKTLKNNGCDYEVKAVVAKDYFNTRVYDGFVLPAGEYNCLKIVIGSGKGHNWWCVMFPAVCISGCTDDFDGCLTENEKRMITSGGYKVRFKTVEIIERIKNKRN